MFAALGCESDPKPKLYFCGCEACARAARQIGQDAIYRAHVIFTGGPADAREFKQRFCPLADVELDSTGSIAASSHMDVCPAVSWDGKRVLSINGGAGSSESADDVARRLSAK